LKCSLASSAINTEPRAASSGLGFGRSVMEMVLARAGKKSGSRWVVMRIPFGAVAQPVKSVTNASDTKRKMRFFIACESCYEVR